MTEGTGQEWVRGILVAGGEENFCGDEGQEGAGENVGEVMLLYEHGAQCDENARGSVEKRDPSAGSVLIEDQ